MNKLTVSIILSSILMLITLALTTSDDIRIISSNTNCCEIHITKHADIALIEYISNVDSIESSDILVELEQPPVDMTVEEALDFEIEETINDIQDYCYRTHFTNN